MRLCKMCYGGWGCKSMTIPVEEFNDDFKETPIGIFPADWEMVALGDLFDECDVRIKELGNGDENIPVLSMTSEKGLILQSKKFGHRVASRDISNYKVVRQGQLVYSFPIDEGVIAILHRYPIGVVSPAYNVWKLKKEVNIAFLDQLLKTPLMIAVYKQFASQTVHRRRNLSKTDFKIIKVPLPPLPEQHAIAETLMAVRRDIEATEAVIAAACETKRAMMKHLFTYGAISGEQVVSISLQETDIGDMPNGWDVIRLEAVIETAEYGLNNRAELIGTYPVFRMNNLVDGKVDITNLKYVELHQKEFVKYRLEKGDVLFNRTNSLELVGKTSLFDLDGDFVFASYLIRIQSKKDKLLPGFLNHYLNWEITQQRLRGLATRGVSQSNISAGKLRTFEIPLPSIPEQNDIVIILESIDAKIQAESQRKSALEALFESLLDQLMTGKLRTMYPITYNVPAPKPHVISEAPSSHLLEAALLAAIIAAQVQRGSHSASRFRNTKLNYFYDGAAERDEALAAYSKQPYGPYDYHKRHDGIEDEMVRRGFARRVDDTHFAPGPNIAEALAIVEKNHKPAALKSVLDWFQKYGDDKLELWATVDYTARELHQQGKFVTAEDVIAAWKQEPRWKPKTAKFTIEDVRKALIGLSKWIRTPW